VPRLELEETALPTSIPAPAPRPAPSLHDHTATAAPTAQAQTVDGQLQPGALLAHFRIDRLLGQGGMGQVYLATDLALDRPVALKVLLASVAHDPGRRQRLIREARAQARIHHPNVCHIYYIGEQDGHLFFAMEYVEGQSVSELVARGPLPVDRALAIVRMAAEGLREADRSGFTHRDVKPSNLMVDRAGRVKIVDFGLVTDAPAGDATTAAGDVAATGIAGTPLYMAPEQARGEPVDRRADVYALGATLYHLVAGAPPFAAATPGELLELHSTALRPALPRRGRETKRLPALDELCRRMMAAEPAARFASYDELIDELDRATPSVTRPAGVVARTAAAMLDLMIMAPFAIISELVPYHLVFDSTVVALPALWLYATVVTWRYGRTLGKALLDLEVISCGTDRRLTLGQAMLRHALILGPLTVMIAVKPLTRGYEPIDTIASVFAVLALAWGVAAQAWASLRRPDKRTLWDLASRTMVTYRRSTLAG
jgi:predicted Ser/Thr protein kinase/uncharacterized RDD family membrane protein YckC